MLVVFCPVYCIFIVQNVIYISHCYLMVLMCVFKKKCFLSKMTVVLIIILKDLVKMNATMNVKLFQIRMM